VEGGDEDWEEYGQFGGWVAGEESALNVEKWLKKCPMVFNRDVMNLW
jgi:hypothetical protein